ncbi:hypothetical protein [Kribbella sp. CA-293567]|uniref:hypothetical protein n=1 Tax=Kribbella sp. CA-293567 TaxID=3002436 RepID=UPI0022DD4DCF|nr:hypothetical protein [Kribbella sp. CA-293567]WBQ02979.1 hypothetical protein OX958_23715 [Kribbella sp. CA-293567]
MQQQDFPQYAPRPRQPRYPLTEAAEARQTERDKLTPYVAVALAIAIVIAGVLVFIVLSDNIAARAGATADKAPVPSAQPGPPVPQPIRTKPTEKSPPVHGIVTGDGTWIIGKDIKRTTYESVIVETCYWARLTNLSGDFNSVTEMGFGRTGKQIVELGPNDVAFQSDGCGEWTEVR